MKKFLLVFFVFVSFGLVNKLTAQCTVSNVVINITNTDQTNPNNIKYTVDVYFDMENNSGNKWVFIHVWKTAGYPVGFFPGSGSGTLNPPTNGTPTQGNLDEAILNIGFNNNNSTAGYLSYIQQGAYLPDPGVRMTTGTGNVTLVSGAPSGYQRYFMQGVTVETGQGFSPPLSIKANLWSSQAAQLSKAQCWTGELSLTLNDPFVSGRINCTTVVDPRTLSFTISTTSAVALGGSWKAYVDNNLNGFDALDVVDGADATGDYNGLTSSTPIPLTNITYTGGSDPLPVKPVYIVIDVATPFVLNNALVYPLINSCASLPVSLRNFNAAQRSGKVALTWETDQENGNDGFEIQRRIGNGQYVPIGFVDSKAPDGTGGAYSYSFDDNQTLSNTVAYYRLRQVDINNKSSFSEIKAIRAGKSNFNVAVYPNPSRGTTNVAIPEGTGKMDISLDDFTGKSIQRWSGLSTQNLQITNLKAGLYMLRITIRETGEQITERIMVQ